MKKILSNLIIIFCLNSVFTQTQKAELFFLDNTSVKGYAEIKNNDIRFRVSLDEKPDKWGEFMVSSLIIEEFGFDVEYKYLKINSNDPKKLLQVQAEGEVNLYADIKRAKRSNNKVINNTGSFVSINNKLADDNNNYTEKVRFYVKSKNKKYPTALFGNGSFRKKAKLYFNNCIGIQEKLTSKEFDVHNANKMVNYYNDFCAE